MSYYTKGLCPHVTGGSRDHGDRKRFAEYPHCTLYSVPRRMALSNHWM
jgi:hypothetical protein